MPRYALLPVVLFLALLLASSAYSAPTRLDPTAFAGPDIVAVTGAPVTFYGSAASPDDEIVEYRWDLDGDGSPDYVSQESGAVTHVFTDPGDYTCVLTIEDSEGRTASSDRRVIVVADPSEVESAGKRLVASPVLANPADGTIHRYAVVMNGGGESRYWTDVQLAYDMLTLGYGFTESDVYVLNYDGSDPQGQNPGGMIDYACTMANLNTVFSDLASVSDADDEVFICISDHGRGYSGPLSQAGAFLGYMDGRASVDPGDEPDFLESDFKLRSIFTGGDYRCNHGMNVWKVYRKTQTATKTRFYRNNYVSQFTDVYIEDLGTTISDSDVYIERFTDYALGDTNRDGYIDTSLGEVFDYDGDGVQPYDHSTGQFDEDDWGNIDKLDDDHNFTNGGLPEGGYPYKLFDQDFNGKICIDLAYAGGTPEVDGRDEDGQGLFDWMDVNQDGDVSDTVSVDEAILYYGGDLYDDEFAALVDTLSVSKITIVALPCFSGGLVEDLTAPNRVICTATIEEAVSWGNIFIRNFIAALHRIDEYGTTVDADANQNGYISMLEAFNWAAANDPLDEIPQYDDDGDGVSHTDPVPSGGDGALGAETYLCATPPLVKYFEWEPVPAVVSCGIPVPVTVTARDYIGAVVEGFEGAVDFSACAGGQGERTIGTGITTYSTPLASAYSDCRMQLIYLASEVGSAGLITSLSLNVSTVPASTLNAWTIRMKHTPLSEYASPSWETSGWTVVHQSNQAISSTGWVTFEFTTPFAYDGVDNLMVDFSFNNDTAGASNGYCRAWYSAEARTIYCRVTGSFGDPLTWSGTYPFLNITNCLPDIKLGIGSEVGVEPATSGAFSGGVWQGSVTLLDAGSEVVLTARDSEGHAGATNAFEVRNTVAGVRARADGTAVGASAAVVTAAFTDFFYIEADDRSSGIRVNKPGHGLAVGMRADVAGTVNTNADGERCIDAVTATQNGAGTVDPLGMNNRAIGGGHWLYNPATGAGQEGVSGACGLNNIGLLIRTWGRVTSTGADYFVIDDGSQVDVKCEVPAGVTLPSIDDYVGVTGVSSCEMAGEELHRLVRVRDFGDIDVL